MLRSIIYNSLILAHMHYALLASGTKCHKIELLQKKALRIIFSKSPVTTELWLKKVNQPKLSDLYIINLLKLYYKLYRNRLPTYFECFFPKYGGQVDIIYVTIYYLLFCMQMILIFFWKDHDTVTTILELKTELLKIESWLVANRLTLNVSKTHYMIFHRSRIKTVDHDLILNGNVVTSTKFLGIIVDDQLKWKQHIDYIKNKISKSIGIIYKARNYVNKHTLRNLYYTFVYPYLIYCVEVWGNTCDSYLEPLILKQKQCIRTITFSQFKAHTEPLFQELNILSFHKLVIHRISLLMYKNYADIYIRD